MSLTDRVVVMIDEAIDASGGLIPACEAALGRIKREGLGDELLAEHGVRLLSDLYRSHAVLAEWTAPGSAKIVASAVNRAMAIFRWYEAVVDKRLGDCTEDDLKTLADHRASLAEANRAAAKGYTDVARELKKRKAKTVHAGFKNDPDKLRSLLRGARDAA